MFTELKDRILWYDGTTETIPSEVINWLQMGIPANSLAVTDMDSDIIEYNELVSSKDKITTKLSNNSINASWTIPSEYQELDVLQLVLDRFDEEKLTLSDSEIEIREQRIANEFSLFVKLQMLPVLRALIYVINTLRAENVVWGVGRGSSVSSYILYLLGVHDVDSVRFELDIKEFIAEE